MFGHRTPVKKPESNRSPPKEAVRKSIDKWEAAMPNEELTAKAGGQTIRTSATTLADPPAAKPKVVSKPVPSAMGTAPTQGNSAVARRASVGNEESPQKRYVSRAAEAAACLNKAKAHLRNSRNLKTEIKEGVEKALTRLLELVKESEAELKTKGITLEGDRVEGEMRARVAPPPDSAHSPSPTSGESLLMECLVEHTNLIRESGRKIEELKATIERHTEKIEKAEAPSYAGVTAAQSDGASQKRTLHSVAVASTVETETGEEVLERVRKAIDAKEGWVKVERVRKAKNRKIIMGFGSKEERDKVKERIGKEGGSLTIEDVENKDPLVRLGDVLSVNTDEDILKALRNQNGAVFHGLGEGEDRIAVKYRKRARNPHTNHVIISVSPSIWRRVTERGYVYIDLQRVRAEDQTPLVQCTRCLGYGHGRKYCQETVDACSHCGGPHLRTECADWIAGEPPACRNCGKAKLTQSEHNAFSPGCPVRRRREELARSTVAYC